MTTLYLLENEGFHSGKDEGNILQKQHMDTAVTQAGTEKDHLICWAFADKSRPVLLIIIIIWDSILRYILYSKWPRPRFITSPNTSQADFSRNRLTQKKLQTHFTIAPCMFFLLSLMLHKTVDQLILKQPSLKPNKELQSWKLYFLRLIKSNINVQSYSVKSLYSGGLMWSTCYRLNSWFHIKLHIMQQR